MGNFYKATETKDRIKCRFFRLRDKSILLVFYDRTLDLKISGGNADHLIFRGGGVWDFFETIVCFPTGVKKIKCLHRS